MLWCQLDSWPSRKVCPFIWHSVIIFHLRSIIADRKYDNDAQFRQFKRQLFHASIAAIFESVRSAMTTPIVCRCPDGHFRRVIFDFGSFIADYPEQVMLAGIVQGWCPK